MLLKLTIENYALIDRLDIDFSEGFSVITGETGAGKSILLGALSLLLGQRADASVLLNKEKKCIVEGIFLTAEYHLEGFFNEHELDAGETTILRREINQGGKSRAFINDTPVNLPLLKDLGDRLVNIHSQHAITTLNDANFQLAVVDSYAHNASSLKLYRENFRKFLETKNELDDLVQQEEKARKDKDYYTFLFNELDEAQLQEGEQEEIEQRLEILSHAEEIKTSLVKALNLLSEGELNILNELSTVASITSHLSIYHPLLKETGERIQSNLIDLKDIADELNHLEQGVVYDPKEIETLTERLDMLYHLQKKNAVQSVAELILKREDLSGRLQQVGSLEEQIERVRKEQDLLHQSLMKDAIDLSAKRSKVLPEIGKKLVDLLSKLGIPHARMQVEIKTAESLTRDGLDSVCFLFSANKGIEMAEVSRIASGGELSRLMLSIKSLISQKNLLPTIIFDEIDSGVSGEIAGKVGSILRSMGQNMQVIAITHLPQIAGQGTFHFRVFKTSDAGTTRTQIKELSQDERVTEIAKMLSNEKVTDSAMITARELLLN